MIVTPITAREFGECCEHHVKKCSWDLQLEIEHKLDEAQLLVIYVKNIRKIIILKLHTISDLMLSEWEERSYAIFSPLSGQWTQFILAM